MNADDLLKQRRQDWQTLSSLLDQAQKQRLAPEQVKLLGQLYRSTTSDLALARRDFPRHQVTQYLNQLVARSHAIIYKSEPATRKKLVGFVTTTFPQTFLALKWFIFTAALLFFVPAVLTGFIVARNPEEASWAMPVTVQQLIPTVQENELWTNFPPEERPFVSTFIMTNNIRVSFLAYAGGVTAGLLTFYAMVFNGINVGAALGLTAHYGLGFDLFNFMIGHGVVELTVIFMAGGAGLHIGWAILRPGLMSRSVALQLASQRTLVLALGAVPLLMVAGLIEGFISPADSIPWPMKWGVGIVTGTLFYGYVYWFGRGKQPAENNPVVIK